MGCDGGNTYGRSSEWMPSAAMTMSASADGAIGERQPRGIAVLLKAAAAMPGLHRSGRQGICQHVDEVGAVHAEGRVPARGVRDLHRRDRRAVVAEVAGIRGRPARPISPPPVPVRSAADGARCWGSGTRRPRSRRSRAPVRRLKPRSPVRSAHWPRTGRQSRLRRSATRGRDCTIIGSLCWNA